MPKHTRYGITAEHTGADLFVTSHAPSETLLSLATEKAGQLYALLCMTGDYAASGNACGALNQEVQSGIFSLAAELAHETLVLSELAALRKQETVLAE